MGSFEAILPTGDPETVCATCGGSGYLTTVDPDAGGALIESCADCDAADEYLCEFCDGSGNDAEQTWDADGQLWIIHPCWPCRGSGESCR